MGKNPKPTVCRYNDGCECVHQLCESCGWYPPVAEERRQEILELKKYKIPFTGYCEVWAKSSEEATVMADQGNMFFVDYDFGDPECL